MLNLNSGFVFNDLTTIHDSRPTIERHELNACIATCVSGGFANGIALAA